MGHPKKQRRKYSRPKQMFRGREGEPELVQSYGLKNSKELWKAKSSVARIRALARKLLASPNKKEEGELLVRLKGQGLIPKEAKLEDVLKLTVENALDRRLQTVVYKKGLTTSIKQSRQDLIHGHIAVGGSRMAAPSHIVTLQEGEKIDFYAGSPLADPEHPARKIEKKASSDARVAETAETKAGDVKPPAERPKKAHDKTEAVKAAGAMEEEAEVAIESEEEKPKVEGGAEG